MNPAKEILKLMKRQEKLASDFEKMGLAPKLCQDLRNNAKRLETLGNPPDIEKAARAASLRAHCRAKADAQEVMP